MRKNTMRCGFLLLHVVHKEYPKERKLWEYIESELEVTGEVFAEEMEEYYKEIEPDIAGLDPEDYPVDYMTPLLLAEDYVNYIRSNRTMGW